MTPIDIKRLLPVAIEAAEAACKEILEVYNSGDFQTERKDDNSPLTIADKRAHRQINERLAATGIPVLSEEGTAIAYEERKEWKYLWLVDPLDGTKEFLKRNDEFTVNIALLQDNIPMLGILAVPVTGDLYYAVTGEGAFMKVNGTLMRLPKRHPVDIGQVGLRVVASRSHMNAATAEYIHQLKAPQLISAGSSLKFIALAKGDADIYPRYMPSMEWDSAAADVIVREVGLTVVDAVTKQPLVYNKESLLNPFFICR